MKFITAPSMDETLTLTPVQMLLGSYSVLASIIRSPANIENVLELAWEHKIIMIETIDISEENITKAWKRMEAGDVKFRFVLTGYDKYFK